MVLTLVQDAFNRILEFGVPFVLFVHVGLLHLLQELGDGFEVQALDDDFETVKDFSI